MDEAVRTCLQRGLPLRAAVFMPGGTLGSGHWHALTPTDATGRVVTRTPPKGALPLLTNGGREQLRSEISAYDAGGGYANAAAVQ